MIVARESLRQVLTGAGASDDELRSASERLADIDDGPAWYVRAFSGFAGWLSAILLLLSLFIADVIDLGGSGLVLGLLLALGAAAVRAQPIAQRSAFVQQLTFALVVAGEILAVMSVMELLDGAGGLAVSALLMAVMVVIYIDPLHRFGATMAAGILASAFVFEVSEAFPLHVGATPLFAAGTAGFLWESEIEASPFAAFRTPVAFGCIAGTFGLVMMGLWGPDAQRAYTAWTGIGLTAVTVVALLWSVSTELQLTDNRLLAGAALTGTALGVITVGTPGIVAALGTLLLAFHRRNPLLFGLGTAFLAAFLGWFYYDLALTLWAKSGVLVGSGVLLLGARYALDRRLEAP